MKKTLVSVLITLLLLPAFSPWMPHGFLNALHVQQETHHAVDHHGHSGHHQDQAATPAFHSIHFDVVTYFNDHLHVDLMNADGAALEKPVLVLDTADFIATAGFEPPFDVSAMLVLATGPPPDYGHAFFPVMPVYLATQRLRI